MQTLQFRLLVLIALLAGGVCLLNLTRPSNRLEDVPRWPTDEELFQVPGWQVSPQSVEFANSNVYVTRTYDGQTEITATVAITSGDAAKRIYRAGPEVPLLSNGYTVTPIPAGLVARPQGESALIAHRNREAWLQLAAYGERRGLLGNGAMPWTLALADTVLGRSNDYYVLRVLVPLRSSDELSSQDASAASQLADVLFPRVAGWYGQVSAGERPLVK
jgi:hypothetical protein